MRKNKKIVLAIALLFCISIFPAISSLEWSGNLSSPGELDGETFESVEIISAIVLVADGSIETTLPSEKGGLISSFNNMITRILSFFGTDIYKTESIEVVESFELIAVPSGSKPFTSLTYGSDSAESELITLPGRTLTENVFVTTNVQVEIPGPEAVLHEPLNSIDVKAYDGKISFTDFYSGEVSYRANAADLKTISLIDCGDGSCPTTAEIESVFGLVFNVDYDVYQYVKIPELDGTTFLFPKLSGNNIPIGIIADYNNDGVWDFTDFIDSWATSSYEENSLIILDEGFYDIYVIV